MGLHLRSNLEAHFQSRRNTNLRWAGSADSISERAAAVSSLRIDRVTEILLIVVELFCKAVDALIDVCKLGASSN